MDGGTLRTKLRAAQITGRGKVEMVDADLPEPADAEIRVRIEGCGVCASNLGPWAGPPWMEFPLAPGDLGHEAWGVVDAVGQGAPSPVPGDRVAFLGFRGYASHDIVPAEAAVILPDSLRDQPVPAEPLGCAMMIFGKARVRPGDSVAVIGVGFLGAILVRLAAGAGARVIAVARREESLDLARRMGAAEVVALGDNSEVSGRISGATGGEGCDVAIECTGAQDPLDLAAECLRVGGRLVIAGYHQDGPRQVDMQLWNWHALEIVNAHQRDRAANLAAMRDGVAALADGRIDLAPLLTHRYTLARLGDALDATRDKPAGFVKAIVVPE